MVSVLNGRAQWGVNEIPGSALDSANPASLDKARHLHKPGTHFALAIGATPVAREEIVFVAKGAASIRNFNALLNDTGTSTDVDFDLKVNGVSVLSAAVNITHGDTDRSTQTGTVTSPDLVAGDVVSIELAVTSTTGAQGPFAWVEIDEALGA